MQSVISFFKNIYEHELSQAKSMHLFSGRVLKRYYVAEQEELLTGEYPYIPISDKYGNEVIKTLELKSNEVSLKYYAFARVSRFISLKKHESTRVYPLLAYDAKIVLKDGAYYLHIDLASREVLKNHLPKKIVNAASFRKALIGSTVDFHFASKLHESIKENIAESDTDELLMFPTLWNKKKINAEIKNTFELGDKYIPLGILAIVEKENNSFTTLHELNEMAQGNDYSLPIQVLFNQTENKSEEKQGIICEELNDSQSQAITNSNKKIISVISGPPGTGKSFTIANLAAEKVSKGQSILITSKNKEALTVIEDKIKEQLGINNLCINPSTDNQFNWMKEHLDHVLGRKFMKKNYQISDIDKANSTYQHAHDKHLDFEKSLMVQFQKERDYIKNLNAGLAKNTTPSFRNRVFKYREKALTPLWKSLDSYYQGIKTIRKKAVRNLQMVNTFMLEESVKNYRKELRVYLSFLRAREISRKEKLAEDINYNAVLKAFPVWLIRANDVSKALPLEKEVFDILIIDEASQCDIPSILPLMQRAKKIVIVGDVKQLTHISFISKAFEASCRANVTNNLKHYCQHRDCSILHLVEEFLDPYDRVELNEHFRSQFPIIAFSNKKYYNNNLEILTKRPVSVAEHVSFVQTNGKRTKGYHEKETEVIIQKIQSVIAKEKILPNQLKTSIGILSPFRKQVDYLFSKVLDTFSLSEIKKHKIIVGTAFTFQGNERDLMLLSLSLDNQSVGGSFTFLNRKDVFNVSITRARNTQIIYYSFDTNKLKPDNTLAHFFRFYDRDLTDDLGKSTKDTFCLEIAKILEQEGLKTWSNFDISGVSIDLLMQHNDEFIGIDLIGFPGEMEDYYSLERYKMIERGKIRLFPLSYPQWVGNPEKCKTAILNLIHAVKPIVPPIVIAEIEETNTVEKFTSGQVIDHISGKDVKLKFNINQPVGGSIHFKIGGKIIARMEIFYTHLKKTAHLTTKVLVEYDKKKYTDLLIDILSDFNRQKLNLDTFFVDVLSIDELEKKLYTKYGFIQNDSLEVVNSVLSNNRDRFVKHFNGTEPVYFVKKFKEIRENKKVKNTEINSTNVKNPNEENHNLTITEETIDYKTFKFNLKKETDLLAVLTLKFLTKNSSRNTGYLTLEVRTQTKQIESEKLLLDHFNNWLIGTSLNKIYILSKSNNLVQQKLYNKFGFVVDYNESRTVSFQPADKNVIRYVKFII